MWVPWEECLEQKESKCRGPEARLWPIYRTGERPVWLGVGAVGGERSRMKAAMGPHCGPVRGHCGDFGFYSE